MTETAQRNPVARVDDKCLQEARKLLEALTDNYTRKLPAPSAALWSADAALMANIAADEYRKCVAKKVTAGPSR